MIEETKNTPTTYMEIMLQTCDQDMQKMIDDATDFISATTMSVSNALKG